MTANILSPFGKNLRASSRNNPQTIFFISLLDVNEMANSLAKGYMQILLLVDWVHHQFPVPSRSISRFAPELAFGVTEQAIKVDGKLFWP